MDIRHHTTVSVPRAAHDAERFSTIHFRFDFHATRTRSIIVPACGFDCAPSDAVVYQANRTLKARFSDAQIDDSITAVDMVSGGVGAGTLQTVVTMFEEVPRSVLELARQAYALSPGKLILDVH